MAAVRGWAVLYARTEGAEPEVMAVDSAEDVAIDMADDAADRMGLVQQGDAPIWHDHTDTEVLWVAYGIWPTPAP